MHRDKPLHQCNNPKQVRSNRIRESSGLIDTNTPRQLSKSPRKELGKEDRKMGKPSVLLGDRKFKYTVGVFLSVSGKGHFLAGFLRGGVWNDINSMGGGLE